MNALTNNTVNIKSKLANLSPEQKAALLAKMQVKQNKEAEFQDLVSWFHSQADNSAQRTAISCNEQTLSYQQLNQQANRLANYLVLKGVQAEQCVAICMERSCDLLVAILAVLKSGAAYLPLDPHSPKERLTTIIDDAQAPFVLTQHNYEQMFSDSSSDVCVLDTGYVQSYLAEMCHANLAIKPKSSDLAYVIYTSGSTGTPKGVMVEHGNVARLMSTSQPLFNFKQEDVWTLFHSYAFDFSVWEIWGALLFGGELVVVPYVTSRSPEAFSDLLIEKGVTVLNQTPTAFSSVQKVMLSKSQTHQLRYVIFGGEALEPKSLQAWFEQYGQSTKLINMYGITETTVHVTYKEISQADIDGKVSNIGKPIPDLSHYILDDKQRKVPTGTVGELYVGGPGVTRGYLNRSQLTDERFITPSFSTIQGKLYRSGDLVKQLANGELEYVGRADNQVKLRGFRIELGEINSKIADLDDISDVITVLKSNTDDKQLVSYVILAEGHSSQWKQTLHSHLLHVLPEYMVPAAVVSCLALPTNINGKIDHAQLPVPQPDDYWQKQFVSPTNEVESKLCRVLANLFKLEQVGIEDNFFALGGDSLKTVNLVASAAEYGLYFDVADIFEAPTVAALAKRTKTHKNQENEQFVGPFELISEADREQLPSNVVTAYPMSRLQHGMVYHNQASVDNSVFHNILNQTFEGSIDFVAMKEAFARVMARHDILRTAFDLEQFEQPLQLVYDNVDVPIVMRDISDLAEHEQQQTIAQALKEQQQQRFDLSLAPLFRCEILQLDENKWELIWVEHHAILDGWSVASFMTQITNEYSAILAGKSYQIEVPEGYYRQFINMEQKALSNPKSQQFWDAYLADSKLTQLPLRPNHESARGPLKTMVPSKLFAELKALAATMNVPLKSLFLAAYSKTLSTFANEQDITFGLTSHGRPDNLDSRYLLGLYVTTLPLRMKIEQQSWQSLIKDVHAQEMRVWQQRHYPLSEMMQGRDNQTIFDTSFTFNNFNIVDEAQELDLKGTRDRKAQEIDDFPLSVGFIVKSLQDNVCELGVSFNPDLYNSMFAQQIQQYLLLSLQAMAEDCQQLATILSTQDDAIIAQLQGEEITQPNTPVFLALFERAVLSYGQLNAITDGDEHISYEVLEKKANQLAHYLIQQRNIKVGDRVGLLLSRSLDMAVAILAVMKAGAAYVPIDPQAPQERNLMIMQDAGLAILLTQSQFESSALAQNINSLVMDTLESELALTPTTSVSCCVSEQDLAYLMYTSGSTGTPKAVMVSHGNLAAYLDSAQSLYSVTYTDRVLQFSTFGFDIFVEEFFCALSQGANLIFRDNDIMDADKKFWHFMATQKITIASLPTAFWHLLVDQLEHTPNSNLRLLITGGEKMSEQRLARWQQHMNKEVQLFNTYGPTEATVIATAKEVSQLDCMEQAVPLGKALDNTGVMVYDAFGNPVPSHVVGEIYIYGPSVAKGYWQRDDLTAKAFVNIEVDGVSYPAFKTGDFAYINEHGELIFAGRSDDQVKIRGYRVEPQEIQQCVQSIDGVESALINVAKRDNNNQLQAFVKGDSNVQLTDIKVKLAAKLPEYMVPTLWANIEQWPLTLNGKIDTKALPDALPINANGATDIEKNEMEQSLADIWGALLEIDTGSISPASNFFDLGGHSLLMTRLLTQIQSKLGCELQLNELLQHGSLQAMAKLISDDLSLNNLSELKNNDELVQEMEW
ncbi:Surfactin synthase subunit 2 [Pseudoalteromonas sp. CIP111854]|uniref:Surfactin synthase subunit 2 n=1 Tax=Pseudoalteromonas holothuriae TaxID=2963714 RepID=A0A9W4W0H1_9GAMM|nr:non-ribosomal peptide synthetase [Pseudoalteromonas sp. CIP111854]CAH9060183.1 Surfactin synthase subunit 2 [Pseudoalteromonas sp. CIP111854]